LIKIYGAGITPKQKLLEKFGQYLDIAHLLSNRSYCSTKKELLYFAAKQSISLLRYTKVLPVDKTFMEAGKAAKV
jgi:intraflagellar transport protein 172